MTEDTGTREPTRGERWKEELAQAKRYLAPWHDTATKILKRLKDQRSKDSEERRINLFTAEYLTKRAVLYGKTPSASVSRRWKDAGDDVARVAGEMLSRHLNDDICSGADGYERALGYVLEDRLHVGMGQARVRYEVETEPIQETEGAEAGEASPPGVNGEGLVALPATSPARPMELDAGEEPGESAEEADKPPALGERKVSESVQVDYIFWRDFLWSPCRYWEVCRWVAFKAEMSRKALTKRFGSKGASLPLDATTPKEEQKEGEQEPPWGRATVWEIWDREEREVIWCTENGTVLDVRKDPLQLRGFFPCPRPFFSLITTEEMVPRPDYVLAEDLYGDLDTLSTRMHLLRSALRIVGMYDSSNEDLADLLNNTGENRMVPVKNWALFGEKGGLGGAVDFFPIQQVAETLTSLSGEYEALKARLYEVTGFSDILRGQGASQAVTATEQRIKAQFGSARLQNVSDEFARFATELQALKAEVIARHFDPEEIIRASNMMRTPDAALAQQAAQFLKDDHEQFRVKVQPEALALADFAAVKEERLEVVQAVAEFIAAVTPMLQMMPAAAPTFLEILKWLVASLRGSSEIEGVLDRAMAMAQQAAAQPPQQPQQQPKPPDSKVIAEQVKAQGALVLADKEHQHKLEELQAEVVADGQRETQQRVENVREATEKALIQRAMRAQSTGPAMSRGEAP